MKKICLAASSGGHLQQLRCLEALKNEYDCFFVSEKTKYHTEELKYTVPQINRKEPLFLIKLIMIVIKSIYILLIEKPEVLISTGALSTIPLMYFGKKLGCRIIYIESFAKISSPTLTGKFIYKRKIAHQFYVQWESMKEFYPDAIYIGGIY